MRIGIDDIASFLRGQLRVARVPGAAIALVQGTGAALAIGHGRLGLADQRPVTAGTRFHLASGTKVITALTIAALARNGILDPDQRLPGVAGPVYAGGQDISPQVSITMLLSHTAGLPHHICPLSGHGEAISLAELVTRVLPRLPLVAPPGHACSYSNLGAAVAAYVAERVCGRPFPSLAEEHVLTPLGLTQTCLGTAPEDAAALPHAISPAGQVTGGTPLAPAGAEAASSLATSSAQDLLKLLTALLPGSPGWLAAGFDEDTRSFLYTVTGSRHRDGELGFTRAFLGRERPGGQRLYSRSGGVGGFGIRLFTDPEGGNAAAFAYNLNDRSLNSYMTAVGHEVMRRLGGRGPRPVTRPPAPDRAGRQAPVRSGYYLSRYGGVLRVLRRGPRQEAELNGMAITAGTAIHPGRPGIVYCDGVPFLFAGEDPFPVAGSGSLAPGTYTGECFGSPCTFVISDSGQGYLTAGLAGRPASTLHRVGEHEFVCADGIVTAGRRSGHRSVNLYGYTPLIRQPARDPQCQNQ